MFNLYLIIASLKAEVSSNAHFKSCSVTLVNVYVDLVVFTRIAGTS